MKTLRAILTVVLQRLAFGLLVLLLIGYLSYFGLEMARRQEFGEALWRAADKTLSYFGQLAQGDLGMTAANSLSLRPVPIIDMVPEIIVRSLGLLLASLLVSTSVGVVLGVWAARRRYSLRSLVVLAASIIGVSLPSFFAALLLQMGVIRLTQTVGKTLLPVGGFGWDLHLVLPALVLSARPLAQITRVTFITVSEILAQDYVRTAHSKGLTERVVMVRHVILNAAVPVLTTIGVSIRYSLVSLPVVEFFFSWPGIGFTLLKAIAKQDDNLTVILVLALGLLFILVNLVLDLIYRLIDPQLRAIPEHITVEKGDSIWKSLRSLWRELPASIKKMIRSKKASPENTAQTERWFSSETTAEIDQEQYAAAERSVRNAWLRGTLKNPALILGSLFLLGLMVMILFSPSLSPHSPYTTQGLTFVDGEFLVPPFAPDETYPMGTDVLGRDIMSLILAGAQQTMLLAVLVVLARMVIGFALGALAGWANGSWLDRLIMGVAEVIAAFPALLLAMILILALGIRNGIQPFIISLCFVGWGEIMQFVRGEVMNIQTKLYIESAVAAGLNSLKIIFRHILPNLASALISITALEMGAVLMLLGELGFIGIFIGGGAFADLDIFGPPYHYSDVPEWGALLSNVRPYARAYPWTAIYPSLAFFMVILGFNFLGEGIRRLIDVVGVRIVRIFNRYTVTAMLVIGAGFVWMRGQTGAMSYFQRQAETFDAAKAMEYIEVLADPDWNGRAIGSPGLDEAAAYIAEQFKALDIQPAGDNMTYFQSRDRSYAYLDSIPSLWIDDGEANPIYHQDYVELPFSLFNTGLAEAPVRFLETGELQAIGDWNQEYMALRGLDYSGEILMLLSSGEPSLFRYVPHDGLLIVADNPETLQRRYTLSPMDLWIYTYWGRSGIHIPALWISPEIADRLLKPSGQTVADLRRASENLMQDELLTFETGSTAKIEVQASIEEKVSVNHVLGYLPGTKAGGPGIDPEAKLDNRMIVVMAKYDNPNMSPDGGFYPGANDNASAVAVMLEVMRTMRDSGYEPYKTFLFVAYSSEGFEGGGPVVPEVRKFLQTKYGFSENFEIEAIVELRGLGSAEGDSLEIIAGGSLRLADLFESSARRMNVPARRTGNDMDISIVFEESSSFAGGEEAPTIGLVWEGWESTAGMQEDAIDSISLDSLEASGRAISLALMILGRETDY